MKRFCKLVSDYMGVLVLLSALAALLFPGTLGHLKPRLINPLLGVIMFGMGLTLKAEDFKVVFTVMGLLTHKGEGSWIIIVIKVSLLQ